MINSKPFPIVLGLPILLGLAAAGPVEVELGQIPQAPKHWLKTGANPDQYELAVDHQIAHGGRASQRLQAKGAYGDDVWAASAQMVWAEPYRGRRVRLSGYLLASDVTAAGLWFRVDGDVDGEYHTLGFDNMHDRRIHGTAVWERYDLVLDVPDESVVLVFGALLIGSGTLWVDDLKVEFVPDTVPVTGVSEARGHGTPYRAAPGVLPFPMNLDFELPT